jgi:hypothetical protein
MKAKDDTFRLIKALTQGEKRLLKLSAMGLPNKNYLRLFDAIDHQEEYDEKKIKQKFAKETFIRHLSSEKNYLHTNILKMIRNSAGENILQGFFLAAAEVEALFSKGLFDLALEKVVKLFKEAEAYEFFGLAQELLAMERTIFMRTNRSYALKRYKSWEEDFDRLMEKQENIMRFVKLNQRIALITYTKGSILDNKQQDEYKHLITTGVMKNVNQAKSPSAITFYHVHKLSYYSTVDDLGNALKHTDLMIANLHDHPFLIRKSPQNYITSVCNHITFLLAENRLEEAGLWLDRLEMFPKPFDFNLNHSIGQFKIQRTLTLRLHFLVFKADRSTLKNDVELIRKTITQKKIADDFQLIVLHFGLGQLFFNHKEYKESLKEFSWLIEFGPNELAVHYKTLAKILIALIHIEKGTPDVVPYLSKKFKFNKLEGVEKLLADFICQTLAEVSSPKEIVRIVSDFKKTYVSHPDHVKLEHYFNFIDWIDSAIEGKTMAETIKGKAMKRK